MKEFLTHPIVFWTSAAIVTAYVIAVLFCLRDWIVATTNRQDALDARLTRATRQIVKLRARVIGIDHDLTEAQASIAKLLSKDDTDISYELDDEDDDLIYGDSEAWKHGASE